MACICCGNPHTIIESHVISTFIRKAITGIQTKNGKKYSFKWYGRRDLPRQNLPKPKLLCSSCDNEFGHTIESPASRLLLPAGDLSTREAWDSLLKKVRVTKMPFEIGGISLKVGEYQLVEEKDDYALNRFSVLTAWRALHAMSTEGHAGVVSFLASPDGQQIQKQTVDFLKKNESSNFLFFPYLASLYLLGPISAAAITGENDEVPFAWSFIQSHQQSCVAVILGFWVIVWPLLPDEDPRRDFRELLRCTFVDWHAQVSQQLHPDRPA